MISRSQLTRFFFTAFLLGGAAIGTSWAQTPAPTSALPGKKADSASDSKPSADTKAPAKPLKHNDEPKSPSENSELEQTDREAAAWGFVMKHHPQLGEVLSRLKIMHIGQYEKAINQITIAADRINKLQKADKARGEMELEDWKLASQIQLAAAKLSLASEDAELQQDLAKIVRKQLEQRLKISEYERDRLQARLKILDDQVAKQKEALANSAELRVNEMLREINRTRKSLQAENNNPKKPLKGKAAE